MAYCVSGLRQRFPRATEAEWQRRLADLMLGEELAARVYGKKDEEETMRYIFGILMLLIGIVAGLAFPDIDLRWDFLGHRSIVTHGLLVPLFLFALARTQKHITTRLLAVGFSLSTAVHLSFDLFPKAWTGYALIYIPGYGRTNPEFSQIWTAVNIVICMYLALVLVNSLFELIAAVIGLLATFSLHAVQTSIFAPVLVAVVVATGIALLIPATSGTRLFMQNRKHEM